MHKEPVCFTLKTYEDDRGSFLSAFRLRDDPYRFLWGNRCIHQVNISTNIAPGTIRGIHFQKVPHSDAKIVRCISGSIWDVIVDLRKESKTYGKWQSYSLTSSNNKILFIPEGFAHGYQVIERDSQLIYIHSAPWEPMAESGVRFDDPSLAIPWPLPPSTISDRDLTLPFLDAQLP